jgi:hypothetical protein
VRRAFALATDKLRIINKLTKGAENRRSFCAGGVAALTGDYHLIPSRPANFWPK